MKCPFCGEPAVRTTSRSYFRCGTTGPDSDGDYETGRTCDKICWIRLLNKKNDELTQLREKVQRLNNDIELLRDIQDGEVLGLKSTIESLKEELEGQGLWIIEGKKLLDVQKEEIAELNEVLREFRTTEHEAFSELYEPDDY